MLTKFAFLCIWKLVMYHFGLYINIVCEVGMYIFSRYLEGSSQWKTKIPWSHANIEIVKNLLSHKQVCQMWHPLAGKFRVFPLAGVCYLTPKYRLCYIFRESNKNLQTIYNIHKNIYMNKLAKHRRLFGTNNILISHGLAKLLRLNKLFK